MNNFYRGRRPEKRIRKYVISADVALVLGVILAFINKIFFGI